MHEVEKDKCVCQKFLNDIRVHAVPILGEWRDTNWNRTEFADVMTKAEYVTHAMHTHHIRANAARRLL